MLTKRYYALGGRRNPLVQQEITPPGTGALYWLAHSEADLHTDAAIEVQMRGDGTGYLSPPVTSVRGRVYIADGHSDPIDVWLRADIADQSACEHTSLSGK